MIIGRHQHQGHNGKQTKQGLRKNRGAWMLTLQCDNGECTNQWVEYESKMKGKKTHFCKKECQNEAQEKGGKLNDIIEATNKERRGVEHPFQSEDVKKKAKATWLKNLGVDHPLKSPTVKARRKKTNLARHGVEEVLSSKAVIEKRYKTNEEKYGDPIASKTPAIAAKISASNKAKTPAALKKRVATNVQKHGVTNTFQLPQPRKNAVSPKARRKAHETLKANRKQGKPTSEDRFYDDLCTLFGTDNVERQVLMNDRWPVDFYIKQVDTYLQFDGVYNHGLNRTRKQLREDRLSSPRDEAIYLQFLRDRRQDKWFTTHNIRLLRVTDVEVKRRRKDGALLGWLVFLLAPMV